MWQLTDYIKRIKNWAWKPEPPEGTIRASEVFYSTEVKAFLEKAYKRYCATCDIFFKSNAGAAVHKRLKHNKP